MMKFDVKEFNGRNDFNMWCINMLAMLVQQDLFKTLKGVDSLAKEMDDGKKEDLMEWTHSVVELCLSDEILRGVAKETKTTRL